MFITPLFFPGQRVTCVDDNFTTLLSINPYINVPKKDEVYTIRKNYQFTHTVGVTLEEIFNMSVEGSRLEPNFEQSRFALINPANSQVVEVEEELYQAA